MKARTLLYTLALDQAGGTGHRQLAKLLVSSLLRTRFSGDIVVFHNSPVPLYLVPREGVREVPIPPPKKDARGHEFVAVAQSCKHLLVEQLEAADYDKVMFVDCDAIALRNIDHLLEGNWDLAVISEMRSDIQEISYGGYLNPRERRVLNRAGYNSGTWAVRGSRLEDLLRRWQQVEAREPVPQACLREQSAFNRVVLDWDGRVHDWPRPEIALPFCWPNLVRYNNYSEAAIVHAAGGHFVEDKMRFLFGLFAGTFLFDPQLTWFNTMEM
jgi:hypothetical protein